MKRLILVSVLSVMLPVLATAPASNALARQVEDIDDTDKPSSDSTITTIMSGLED